MLSEFPVYSVPTENTSPKFAISFTQGLQRHGINAGVKIKYEGGIWAGFGSPSNWGYLQSARVGRFDWWYADHGYMRRNKYIRVTHNAYQHTGVGMVSSDRFQSLGIKIQPWRASGHHILVCPQSDIFFALHGFGVGEWLEYVTVTLKQRTDRPIRVRLKSDKTPIEYDLLNAHCVVVYTSACAIDAILAGVPAICTHPCAASIMSSSKLEDIENPPRPIGRLEWASVLAYNQWTLLEIRHGLCWKTVKH
jgi:hypothetical protein